MNNVKINESDHNIIESACHAALIAKLAAQQSNLPITGIQTASAVAIGTVVNNKMKKLNI